MRACSKTTVEVSQRMAAMARLTAKMRVAALSMAKLAAAAATDRMPVA